MTPRMNPAEFDPVTEGTPEECAKHIEGYYGISPETELSQLESDIAARDAAKKAEGRREGLEEAAEIVQRKSVMFSCCQNNCRVATAIRAAKEEKDV